MSLIVSGLGLLSLVDQLLRGSGHASEMGSRCPRGVGATERARLAHLSEPTRKD
jgi:hypothetical protein